MRRRLDEPSGEFHAGLDRVTGSQV